MAIQQQFSQLFSAFSIQFGRKNALLLSLSLPIQMLNHFNVVIFKSKNLHRTKLWTSPFWNVKRKFFFVIFYLLFTVENDFENSRQNIHRQNWLNGCFGEVFFFVGARYDTKCSLTLAMLYFTHLQPFYMDRFLDFSTRLHCARWPFSFSNQNNFHAFGTLWYYKSEHIFNKHTNCKLTFGIISTHIQTYTKKNIHFFGFLYHLFKNWLKCLFYQIRLSLFVSWLTALL